MGAGAGAGVPVSPGLLLEGRYRLGDRIAAGAMGEVWRATDLVLDRPVAVKLLRPGYARHEEGLARFRAEARNTGLLSHPGIATVYDYREVAAPYPPYLVMELVDGPSLARLLDDGPLDPARTMGLIAQAAAALQAAHAAGLVHRDIKPGNLLVSQRGQVKITDFGIAQATGCAPLTQPGMLIGTPAYLAPERVAGAPAKPAADLYALGIVAFQCLTGKLPFDGEPLAVAVAHQEQPLPRLPSSVPAEVAALVASLTAKDPLARPASAGEVAGRAEHLRAALAATATRQRRKQDQRVVAGLPARAFVALAAIAVIGTGGWVMAGGLGPPSARPQSGLPAATQQPSPRGSHAAYSVVPARRTGNANVNANDVETPVPGDPSTATQESPAPSVTRLGPSVTQSGMAAPSGTQASTGTAAPGKSALLDVPVAADAGGPSAIMKPNRTRRTYLIVWAALAVSARGVPDPSTLTGGRGGAR
jgi:hypothetical protein